MLWPVHQLLETRYEREGGGSRHTNGAGTLRHSEERGGEGRGGEEKGGEGRRGGSELDIWRSWVMYSDLLESQW